MLRRAPWIVALVLVACAPAPEPSADAATDSGAEPERCGADAECDDGRFCNGEELCSPASAGADARGCAPGVAPCGDASCDEGTDACAACTTDVDGDGARSSACGGSDCDDADPERFPGNAEVCDTAGHDEDCDDATYGFRDADGDGYADARCCNGTGASRECGTDCDDMSPNVHPSEAESCNSIDDDCDGAIDEGSRAICYADGDRDGYAAAGTPATMLCTCSDGFTATAPTGTAIDCDDGRSGVNPAVPEVCGNGLDDDCDGAIDTGGSNWWPDCDSDGFGDPGGTPSMSCGPPGTRPSGCTELSPGWSFDPTDCDDHDAAIRPGTLDLCNGIDDDCDPSTRDGATDPATVPETCNGMDDDCDGTADEDFLEPRALYVDTDRDTYGTTAVTLDVPTCATTPAGYATRGGDCCDTDARARPGTSSYYDTASACGSFDFDCDGVETRSPTRDASWCSASTCSSSPFTCSAGGSTTGSRFFCYTGTPACGSFTQLCNCGSCGSGCPRTIVCDPVCSHRLTCR